jgi:hypothetical protein
VNGARLPRGLLVRLLGAVAGAGLVAAPVLGYAVTRPSSAGSAAAHIPPAVSQAGLKARSGVRLIRVAASGGGGLLDVRYQVVDADRALAVHEAETPPAIIDERTGAVIDQLFMGHMHHGRAKAGVSYYLIFENPGGVATGSRVTVQLGDARLAHVVVR